ncbi:unnamed protein product [Dovyalis caffra]|uniref:Uncharacterized protein n=1 Tax=Dovyalis caffra TaxID=77055 RepID=A0AAV1SN27_9ROSI|nr:unnamed protein product [Dovyalis caffra]
MHFSVFYAFAYTFLAYPDCLVGDGQKRLRPTWMSMTSTPQWVDIPSSVAYRKHEAVDAFKWVYGANASGITDGERVANTILGCEAVAIRSCNEFEGEYLSLYEKLVGKPVVPVGFLPPENPQREIITDDSWIEIFKWLDEQKPKSVVFPLNARYLVEKGLGVEVERSEDGSINRDCIAMALRHAMVSEEGKILRERTSQAAMIFGNQKLHQDHYIGKLVHFLRNKRGNT